MDFHHARIVSWWIPQWVLECPQMFEDHLGFSAALMSTSKTEDSSSCFSSCFALRAPFLPVIRFDSAFAVHTPLFGSVWSCFGSTVWTTCPVYYLSSSWPKTHWRIFKNPTLIFLLLDLVIHFKWHVVNLNLSTVSLLVYFEQNGNNFHILVLFHLGTFKATGAH